MLQWGGGSREHGLAFPYVGNFIDRERGGEEKLIYNQIIPIDAIIYVGKSQDCKDKNYKANDRGQNTVIIEYEGK